MEARRPVHEMLKEVSGRMSGHMPGHKGQAPFGAEDLYALDTTELPVTDDFYEQEGALREAAVLYAKAVDAAETLFLHNGTTAGIHAMIEMAAGEGETVLLPRNAHLSAVNACIIGGIEPVWMPMTCREDGYVCLAEETVLQMMARHPEAKAVLITRPDYYGGCIALERIAEKAHDLGMRLLVDEAHGAHLPWAGEAIGIADAGKCGADAWVQSVHKTLPGFTACAVLNLRNAADRAPAMRVLRREQTSSPSFLMMMAIDDARAWMELYGRERLAETVRAANMLRRELTGTIVRDAHLDWADTGYAFDPTRLVLAAPMGGEHLATALRAEGYDIEMWDERRVVIILTAMDDAAAIARLGKLLHALPAGAEDAEYHPPHSAYHAPLPEKRCPLRRAAMANAAAIPLTACVGRIAAVSAGLYPPGVPLVCPGETISQLTAAALAAAPISRRFGTEGDTIQCLQETV